MLFKESFVIMAALFFCADTTSISSKKSPILDRVRKFLPPASNLQKSMMENKDNGVTKGKLALPWPLYLWFPWTQMIQKLEPEAETCLAEERCRAMLARSRFVK